MAFIVADRVKETTATTGTGTLSLGGAVAGYQSFVSGVGTGNVCNYCLLGGNGTDWETGIGLVTSGAPNTLSRGPITSNNANAAISLTGTSTIFVTETAAAFMMGIGGPVVPPPKAVSWTQRSFGGTTTLTDVANGVRLFSSSSAAPVNLLRGVTITSPATPYTIDMNFSYIFTLYNSGSYAKLGACWSDGTKAQALSNQFQPSNVATPAFEIETYTTFTTGGSILLGVGSPPISTSGIWMRLADDGTNVTFSFSNDGINFLPVYTTTKAAGYLGTSGYSNVGWFINEGTLGNTGLGSGAVILRSWWVH